MTWRGSRSDECIWTTQRRERRRRRPAELRHRPADEGPGAGPARPRAAASSRRSSPRRSTSRTTARRRRVVDRGDAMARLADRQAQSGEQGQSQERRLRGLDPPHQGAGPPAPARARRSRSRGHPLQGRARRGIPPDHRRGARRAEDQPQPPRAVRARKGAGRRAARPRPARGAAQRPRHQRHHGQRPEADLHRKEGQARARPDPVPRRGASAPDRPAHRQQGRPPRRPDHAARRRPPPGRQPRQRHHPAALAARHRHLDP